jgi:hypothetical protein
MSPLIETRGTLESRCARSFRLGFADGEVDPVAARQFPQYGDTLRFVPPELRLPASGPSVIARPQPMTRSSQED